MNVKTFQARTLADALQQVREEFGPDATVLETGSRPQGLWRRLFHAPWVEVTAQRPSNERTPDDFTTTLAGSNRESFHGADDEAEVGYRQRFKQFALQDQHHSLLEAMVGGGSPSRQANLPASLFRLYNDFSEAEVDDHFAREILEEVRQHSTPAELSNTQQVKEKAREHLIARIRTVPQINTYRQRRIVALIGPTGVGKTTTIAKLAANLRLRDKRRVGLITVDTYRIAAVEQLRAYAEIIDLPMEVVTTPREMRTAIAKLSEVDIVLIDTAGRNSHDSVQIQELRSMLAEAQTDEVQLVLSGVASGKHLLRLMDQFGDAQPTSLLLTKLDELDKLGHLLPVLCGSLPLSYTTHGQNVPDDIQVAHPRRLVESVLA